MLTDRQLGHIAMHRGAGSLGEEGPALAGRREPWSVRPELPPTLCRGGDCGAERGGHSPEVTQPNGAGPVPRAGPQDGEEGRGGSVPG